MMDQYGCQPVDVSDGTGNKCPFLLYIVFGLRYVDPEDAAMATRKVKDTFGNV